MSPFLTHTLTLVVPEESRGGCQNQFVHSGDLREPPLATTTTAGLADSTTPYGRSPIPRIVTPRPPGRAAADLCCPASSLCRALDRQARRTVLRASCSKPSFDFPHRQHIDHLSLGGDARESTGHFPSRRQHRFADQQNALAVLLRHGVQCLAAPEPCGSTLETPGERPIGPQSLGAVELESADRHDAFVRRGVLASGESVGVRPAAGRPSAGDRRSPGSAR